MKPPFGRYFIRLFSHKNKGFTLKFGSQTEILQIKSILLKRPEDAFINQKTIDNQWNNLNYLDCPDYLQSIKEYEYFVSILKKHVPEIYYLPEDKTTSLDSLYVHDPVIITDYGAILCNMGKDQRSGEPTAIKTFLSELNVPILGEIVSPGKLEGGDVVWIDQKTVAIGCGYRTNKEGIQQFKNLVTGFVDAIIEVPLPHWNGPTDVLHLMSMISPIDKDLAVVYSRLMPVSFRNYLIKRKINLIEVQEDEYENMACNILALAPRVCLMLAGNPIMKKMLINHGVDIFEYEGNEISKKGAGGPTCLTRPILRE